MWGVSYCGHEQLFKRHIEHRGELYKLDIRNEALAAACFVKIMLIDRMLLGNTDVTAMVAASVCLTMALTVLVAKIVGCTLPLLAKKLGFDPAVMASPFITTIVDALSLLIFFRIASMMLHLGV